MKVSYKWLKDYIDVKLDPMKLARILTMAGVNVAAYENIRGDYIFDLEITANRPDCLNMLGVAREVAAVLGKKLKIPKDLRKPLKPERERQKLPFQVMLKDPDLCFRYTARLIKDVEVGPSPDWLKDKIISIGLRPINNIVDITNFVLFETGQPMHAFDFDKIKGNIQVRRASEGEKIITIDDMSKTCNANTIVIADESGPIAIGGVMGGLDTEVNDMTKNVLLESAFFDPVSIRRASRALGISSESSYRFERRIDNSMVTRASDRASALINKMAGGVIGSILDVGRKKAYSKKITLDIEKSDSILGVSIKKGEASRILKHLGFSVKDKRKSLNVTVPSFREDVKTDIDLIEEVARIHGYEKIPLTIPRIVANTKIKDFARLLQEKIREVLTRLGLNEIITYSLISKKSIEGLDIPEDGVVSIKNPLSIDQEIMRPTMLPGALEVISYNLNRKAKHLAFFELGKTYEEKTNLYTEKPFLSIGLAGIKQEDWKTKKQEFSFFDIKGIFEKLLEELGISNISFKQCKKKPFKRYAASLMKCGGRIIGCLGEIENALSDKFDIEKKIFYGELDIKAIHDKIKLERKYISLGRYPPITRDISVVMDTSVLSSDITFIVKESGKDIVKNVSLVDCYMGEQIPKGKKGLLYRIEYRSNEKTLQDKEVDETHSKIKNTLSEKLGIAFR